MNEQSDFLVYLNNALYCARNHGFGPLYGGGLVWKGGEVEKLSLHIDGRHFEIDTQSVKVSPTEPTDSRPI